MVRTKPRRPSTKKLGMWEVAYSDKFNRMKTHIIVSETGEKVATCGVVMTGVYRDFSKLRVRVGHKKATKSLNKIHADRIHIAENNALLIASAPRMKEALGQIRDIARASDGVEFYAMLAEKALDEDN
jgi:hypothetical protein